MGALGFPLPTSLGGVSVEVIEGQKTTLAPLYMVSPGQINAVLPYDVGPLVQVRVRTAAGVTAMDSIGVGPSAPCLFTVDQSGFGRAVATDVKGGYLTRTKAARPGDVIMLWANSMGAVSPAIAAGVGANDGSPGAPLHRLVDPVSVTVHGAESRVLFAGLTPYYSGLYQMNVKMPFWNVIGDLPLKVKVGNTEGAQEISIPAEPNGIYWAITAGKFPNGQMLRSNKGSNGAIAHVHNDPETFTAEGFRQWTKNIDRGQFGPVDFSPVSGLALTLKNGSTVVYDNNGIETGTAGDYYNNKDGVVDTMKPSMWTYGSMTKNVDSVFAGYFRLTQRTTFDQIIGYFDGNGNTELWFDAGNEYNLWRMNIWSDRGGMPSAPNGFVGDVFSSDRAAGKFSYSETEVPRIYKDGVKDPNYRLVFTLERPMTLEAGEYWFSHDLSITPEAEAAMRSAMGSKRETGMSVGVRVRGFAEVSR
jgi:uncharacterized protein (TIGR03437 family)